MTCWPDVIKAKMYAELAHSGQTYNDEVPYTYHLQAVADVMTRFGLTSPESQCAAYLHDVLEDTNRSYNDIKSRFGAAVAELVYAVTSELGRNRKERNAKTYPKIKEAGNWATSLKLADRIANVEYGAATGGKNDMYKSEYFGPGGFSDSLRVDAPTVSPMWAHLDRLMS